MLSFRQYSGIVGRRVGFEAVVEGLGLLPVETRFEPDKRLEQTTVPVDGSATPVLEGATGTASGYEIHAGRTRPLSDADVRRPLGDSSAAWGQVLGTYLHGLFDNESVRRAFLDRVAATAGVDRPRPSEFTGTDDDSASGVASLVGATPYDRAATLVRAHVDLESLGEPFV